MSVTVTLLAMHDGIGDTSEYAQEGLRLVALSAACISALAHHQPTQLLILHVIYMGH